MKILLASTSPNLAHKLTSLSENKKIDTAETGEDVFNMLEIGSYDCLITEANLMDIDVWSIARFIHNNINPKRKVSLPIFVIKDSHKKLPKLLASNYGIKTIDLSSSVEIDTLINSNCIDKPTILIIEDDYSTADGMRIFLQKEYDVQICNTGREGITCWMENKHDLILLDLMLPGSSGEDIFKEIRSVNPRQAIVIVSARSEIKIQHELLLLGANDYLTKPFIPEALNKTCRVVLTQALYQYELDLKEKKLDYIVNELWSAVSSLEGDDTETTIEILNKVIYSMPDIMANDDASLRRVINNH